MGRCLFPLVVCDLVVGRCLYFACPGLWVFYLVACEACAQYVGDWLYLFYQVVSVSG